VRENVYEFRSGCWWTVPKGAGGAGAGATGGRPLLTIRATDLLVRIASLKNPAHHRCREIALGLAWNLSARDAGLEARLVGTDD